MSKQPFPELDQQKMQRKLRMVDELFRIAYEMKRFQLKQRFPHLPERDLNHRAYALIEKGCS